MALIKSTILAQISGSINGTTFSHNRGGAYARNRSLPTNPSTDRQDQVRTALASIATAWRDTLTDAQRAMWRNWGASQTVINRIGDPTTLSGIAAFQRVNLFRMSTLGQAMTLDTPPAGTNPNPPPTFTSNNITFVVGVEPTMNLLLAGTSASGYAIALYYSGPISPGRAFYRGPYLDKASSNITTGTVTIPMTALGDSATLEGKKIAARATCYDTGTSLPVWSIYLDPIAIPEPTP